MTNTSRHFPETFSNTDEEIRFFQKKELYNFVPENQPFMRAAKSAAIKHSKTSLFPIGIVAVKNGTVLAEAGNGNGYHEENLNNPGHRKGCVRRFLNDERVEQGLEKFKSGEGYELCPGCSTDSHAEANLVKSAKDNNSYEYLNGADVYMYGHYWCCKPCFDKMLKAGINNVYLPDTYEKFKDKAEIAKWAEEVKLARESNETHK